MSTAEKDSIEKMKASMLSINSKTVELIESQAALIAVASVLAKKIVPNYQNLPKQSLDNSRSDPRDVEADFLAGIEAAGISEKAEAYLQSVILKLDKGVESQAALKELFLLLIEEFLCSKCLQEATDEAEISLPAPLPPTVMSDPKAVGELTEELL